MRATTSLTIQKHVTDYIPPVRFSSLGWFYDVKTKIGVYKKRIKTELKVGEIYDFTFDNGNDVDTYTYLIVKRTNDVYYMIEYYNTPYKLEEWQLTDEWEKCDVKEKLGIDLSQY